MAASQGWHTIIDIILQTKKSIHVLIDQRDRLGRNALHAAVAADQLSTVQKQNNQRVSSALMDDGRCNAYHLAAASGQLIMIHTLMKYNRSKLGEAGLVS